MEMRTSKPSAGNKFYITTSNGGYSLCIKGYPTDASCNVLSNCVGYACGRFNEIIGSMKYPYLNCNAENFIERAKSAGLQISNVPTLGGIMVWQKGNTLSGSDGAGHVAIVERIDSANQIYTSESGYGGSAFWNSTRTNGNGRWGQASSYKFRGCIINPAIGDVHYIEPVTTKSIDEIAKEVINGRWGNGSDRKSRLEAAGYDYSKVQNRVNEILSGNSSKPSAPKKTVDELANEVLQGKWGNGDDRKKRLTEAGYNYSTVQSKVNELVNKSSTPTKSIDELAREVIQGKWGNGQDRKDRLTKAGYNYSKIQSRVNELLK